MMMTSDPIADMLTRIRNANTAKHDTVDIPASKIKVAIAGILVDEGFIEKYDIVEDGKIKTIHVTLKYGADKNEKVITGIKRISKPGLRVYAGKDEIPSVLGGLGIAILSTNQGVITDKDETYYADEVVSAIGREGSDWFSHICDDHGIDTEVGTVDIGVRVEVRDEVMEFLNKNLYEAKLVYYTPTFDDKVRTFCTNPSGEVATEYYENGLAVVNGHAYKSKEYKTNNTNFAILVSKNFTKPFKTPIEYGKHIAQLSNMLCDGKILVQTFGDFQRGRRTTEERLCRNNIIPTLKDAVPGDLSLVLPHRIMVDIKEMLKALDKVTPGIASDETLLYGVEVKFYSNKVVVDKDFETNIHGLRAIGDGASVTRGLQQASANGLSVARSILARIDQK